MRGLWLPVLWVALAGPLGAEEFISAAPLFAVAATTTEGKVVNLGSYQGKPLVVNFWARWCGPCREEIPLLVKQQKALRGKQIETLGLAIEDQGPSVAEFAKAYEINYPLYLIGHSGIETMRAVGNSKTGLPFTMGVNRRGQVVYKKLGVLRQGDLEALVQAIQ